jgi:hypothetical protein
MTEPIDDPFCGVCGLMCCIHWQFEDIAGDGPSIWGAEGVSDCCEAELYCDEELKFPFEPDPNDYGAFDSDGDID